MQQPAQIRIIKKSLPKTGFGTAKKRRRTFWDIYDQANKNGRRRTLINGSYFIY